MTDFCFLEPSGNTTKPAAELPRPTEKRGSPRLVASSPCWVSACVFSGSRGQTASVSVGRVSHGRRLVMNTKESQNYELQPASGSRGVSIRGCDSAGRLSQAAACRSQAATKNICDDHPLPRWAIAVPPWFFITIILLSHKLLTRQETRKL